VLLQTVTEAAETPEMLTLAAADPLVAGIVGWTDLTSPAVADELAPLLAGPGGSYFADTRHPVQSEPDPDWLRRPDVIRGLQAVAAAGRIGMFSIRPSWLTAPRVNRSPGRDRVSTSDH
jgi:L-fuconolactonase